jgi:hypothetical protein
MGEEEPATQIRSSLEAQSVEPLKREPERGADCGLVWFDCAPPSVESSHKSSRLLAFSLVARRSDLARRFWGSGRALHDREDADVVLAPIIRAQWFRVTNDGRRPMCPREGVESTGQVDVVDHDHPARSEPTPDALELEEHVPRRMPAVMDEQIDCSQLGEERAKTTPARAADVRPAVAQ